MEIRKTATDVTKPLHFLNKFTFIVFLILKFSTIQIGMYLNLINIKFTFLAPS